MSHFWGQSTFTFAICRIDHSVVDIPPVGMGGRDRGPRGLNITRDYSGLCGCQAARRQAISASYIQKGLAGLWFKEPLDGWPEKDVEKIISFSPWRSF
jgi:hypothetical protein